jgi:Xaa-Pro aminopeptidase
MARDRVRCFLFTDLANVFYLSGFRGTDGALLVTPKETVLLVDGRYGTQARRQAPHCRVIVYAAKVSGIAGEIRKLGCSRIGFEPGAATVAFHESLSGELPNVSWVRPSEWHASLRAIKDPTEIRLMRRANRIVDRAFRETLRRIRPGLTEREIALDLESEMRRMGAEGVAFPVSVAGGENSSLPHARSENRRIRKGEPIFIDFGGCFEGYQTDQTVTLFLGNIPSRWREIYSVVKEAHDLAISSVKPGMRASELDGIARECIARRGFGETFSHSLGHGVGIEIHEYPSVSVRSEARLRPGMVFTVEPGIYIAGEGGVRIEDTILLTPRGAEPLTSVDKVLRAR